MIDFTLDTSGEIYVDSGPHRGQRFMWRNLSPFEQGYLRAAFADLAIAERSCGWCGEAVSTAVYKRSCRRHPQCTGAVRMERAKLWPSKAPGFSDLAPETLAAIRKDCAAFTAHGSVYHEVRPYIESREPGRDKEAGRAFYRSRHSERGGFISPDANGFPVWSRAYAKRLDDASLAFPPQTFIFGDDGRVYLRNLRAEAEPAPTPHGVA